MKKAPLGELELEVLRFITLKAPLTAREVTAQFGEPRGLARTTVLTVMERLHKKGYLTRSKQEGIYHYSPREAQTAVLRDLVRQFVQKTLGGSVSPFFAYLAENEQLSPEEAAALRRLVELMEARQDTGEEKPE